MIVISTFENQIDLYPSIESSLELAAKYENAYPFAVLIGEEICGFLMYGIDDTTKLWKIYRLEVDKDNQNQGFALAVVSSWACAVQDTGAIPMYCTSTDNIASGHLAAGLGLTKYGVDFHITGSEDKLTIFCTRKKTVTTSHIDTGENMAQKHTTIRDGKRLLWYTEQLWDQAKDLESFDVALTSIKELDQNCWFDSREPTLREIAKHFDRIQSVDMAYPIILNEDGSLMDGGHRLCKALLDGKTTIKAVQFRTMPRPNKVYDLPD